MTKLFAKDFGAVGDGYHNDVDAIVKAVEKINELKENVELVFDDNKTYICKQADIVALFDLRNVKNVKICGNNTTFKCNNKYMYINLSRTENVTFEGVNFDQIIRAQFLGTVVKTDIENLSVVFKADRDFPMEGVYSDIPHGVFFGLKDTGNVLSRIFFFIKKYEWVDKSNRLIKVDFGPDSLGTKGNVEKLQVGEKIILPTPHIGHCGTRHFTMTGNKNTVYKDCKIYNIPYFGFGIWGQKESLIFKNVTVAPPIDETTDFVSWRDCFHCKSNSAKFVFDSCTVRGCNDDIINFSSNMMYVAEKVAPNTIRCHWRETGGSYGNVDPGYEVDIWDVSTGDWVLRTTVKSVVDSKNNIYELNDDYTYDNFGPDVRICFPSDCAPGSEIINCDFKGTLRIKYNHTVKNSRLYMLKMFLYPEIHLEGPLLKNVLFENCDFYVNDENDDAYVISSLNNIHKTKTEKSYGIENVVFKNCRGLKKSNFANKSNFDENSVDYIKIID